MVLFARLFISLLFASGFKIHAQDLNLSYPSAANSQSVTVDFSTAKIGPPMQNGYSGTIIVDSTHKIHVKCGTTPCETFNGSLLLQKYLWLPFISYRATLHFDPPAISVSGTISGSIGSSVLSEYNKVGLYVNSSKFFEKDAPPASFSYPFSYTAPSGINLLSMMGTFPQTIGGTMGDVNSYFYLGLNTLTWSTKSNLDLSIGEISIPLANTEADEVSSISPEKEFQMDVPVSATGIESGDTRSVNVTLEIGSQKIQKTIALSELGATAKVVSFLVTLPTDDVGDQTISVSIDPLNALGETNRTNNVLSEAVHVLCNVSDKGKEVPWFYQSQPPWGGQVYANLAPKKMSQKGCLVTTLAMLFSHYGIDTAVNGSPMTPEWVNKGLNNTYGYPALGPNYSTYNGYSPQGDVQPNGAVLFARNSYVNKCIQNGGTASACDAESKKKVSYKHRKDVFTAVERKFVNKELCSGNPVILKVPSISAPNNPAANHFVLAIGMKVNKEGITQYTVNDPRNSDGKGISLNETDTEIRGYRLYRPTDDPSMVFFHLGGDAEMIVIDPLGRRSGRNPFTQQSYTEIPGGTYTGPEFISSLDDPNDFTTLESYFEGMQPISGQYQVQVFAKSNTNYRLTQYSYDTSGAINGIIDKQGPLASGSSIVIPVEHSEKALPSRYADLKIDKAIFFDTRHKDMAFISGQISPSDSHAIFSIERFVQIKVGSFGKSIDRRHLRKTKKRGQTIYSYSSWGKNGMLFDLNVDTGEFDLFIGNVPLDTGDTDITTDIMIQADDVIANNLVTFKQIRKKKHHGK